MWLTYSKTYNDKYCWVHWKIPEELYILHSKNNPCKHIRRNSSLEYIHHVFQKVNKCG